jgi:F0F1-type ATP synthase epsilon subunit
MELIISTPTYRSVYSVVWLEVNTSTGNYVMQKGHAPTIMVLSPLKALTFRLKTGKQETVMVKHGVVKITRESATVVMTVAEE